MFCLTTREYRRWLRLEAEELRSPASEAELQDYLSAIAAAERQVRRWVVAYLRARHRHRCEDGGAATSDEVYRAVAPRLPAVWGARMALRVHVRCSRGGAPGRRALALAGKMLILDEALQALCSSGRVEAVGETAFRWFPAQKPVREENKIPGNESGGPSSAAARRPDLCTFLLARGGFVGFDE
ncbi:MAG TPA: hypothetical protein VJ739_12280 [Gemmataceae bacterium]|nr:hypothetical protein [Gemmataceae bacterium]